MMREIPIRNVFYWYSGYCEGIRQRPGKKLWGVGSIVIDELALLTDEQIEWLKKPYSIKPKPVSGLVQLARSIDNWIKPYIKLSEIKYKLRRRSDGIASMDWKKSRR